MIRYIAYRTVVMIPTLILASLVIFTIIQLPPGDYVETYIGELLAAGETVDLARVEYLRQEYGLDQPMWQRYLLWITNFVQGDFGYSFEHQRPVSDVVGNRIWLTILVSFFTIILTWVIAFPIGIYSATHQYSWGDYGLTFLGLLGMATPNFLLALVMMYLAKSYFGVSIGGLMDKEFVDQPMSWPKFWSIMEHLIVPTIVIGTAGTAAMIRRLRANLLDELQKQY
ncbi:MAG: ABC transporter permease, partial [Pseudomonadota bacterium]